MEQVYGHSQLADRTMFTISVDLQDCAEPIRHNVDGGIGIIDVGKNVGGLARSAFAGSIPGVTGSLR